MPRKDVFFECTNAIFQYYTKRNADKPAVGLSE